MPHLTPEEQERIAYLVPLVESLVGRMGGDGVVDPIATLRAAVDAGRDANEAPILALARGVDATAIRWASEVGRLVIVHDFHDGTRMRLVIHTCLDRIARVDVRASRGSRPPGG